MTDQPTPAELAAKALRGDTDALAALGPVLTATVRKKDRDGSLTLRLNRASDITQDWYVRELEARKKWDRVRPAKRREKLTRAGRAKQTPAEPSVGYYRQAVVNEALDKRKKLKRKKRAPDRAVQAGSGVLNDLADRSERPSQVAGRHESAQLLTRVLQDLTKFERALWERGMDDELTWAAVGKEFDLMPAAARMRWTRLDAKVRALARLSGAH